MSASLHGSAEIEITGLTSSSGPLTKRISLTPEGKLNSDGSACVMGRGTAQRIKLKGVGDFSALIGGLRSNEAIALGALRPDLPETVEITTARRLAEMNGSVPTGVISRTAGHIGYRRSAAAPVLLDYDTKGMPDAVAARLKALGGFWDALVTVAPELTHAGRVIRRSTSSGISRSDTGEDLRGSDGLHVFIVIQDGSDTERFLKALHDRCWLNGLGWMMVGAGGQFLERSIVDRMVFAGERIVFEGAPILVEPLVQRPELRAPMAVDGDSVDSFAVCRSPTIVERAVLSELKAAERHRLGAPAAAAKATFVREHGARIAQVRGISQAAAEQIAAAQCGGVLLPGVALLFDLEEHVGITVAQVLADPERFVGQTLADPLEGVGYGRCKAKIMQRADGSLWVNSFAHGRIAYDLKHDAASVEAAIDGAEPSEAVNVLVKLLINAEIAADDEQRLREMAGKLADVKARPLAARIKSARAEHGQARAAEERDRATATRKDGRIRLAAPLPDAERLPVVHAIDEVLCSVDEPEPPMRGMDGEPVEIRVRAPLLLHELSSVGANQVETKQSTRLPAPEMPLLTKHDKISMAHVVERYIEYETGGSDRSLPRSVAISPGFIEHFMGFRESRLPRVGGVVTAPLVLPDGRLLATQGIDVARRLVFRIPPELLRLIPVGDTPSKDRVAKALDYLVNDWLCDVATTFTGKCVLIAMALTIIERPLLPERPAFFVTAGKRGGGKTTALSMAVLAVTGRKPAAAAWSFNEEERRKALVAYLSEGLAAVIFDNVPLGSAISCPTVEKILTADTYSDRILGQSMTMTVSATTVLAFTGNNIAPKGDLASRSLMIRLDVDRLDPENRAFKHADPVAYTIENRGQILRALYVLLRANPQLLAPKAAKTRFKIWWHLVGSALEHAADCLVEAEANYILDVEPIHDPAAPVDFGAIFRDVEGDDEEAASLGDVLDVLKDVWPTGYFTSGDVFKMIDDPQDGEKDKADRAKAFFVQQGGKSAEALSAMKIGKRLGNMIDTPIEFEGRTLKLVKEAKATATVRRQAVSYYVRQM